MFLNGPYFQKSISYSFFDGLNFFFSLNMNNNVHFNMLKSYLVGFLFTKYLLSH